MPELGPLHIGSNITEYARDATDTLGNPPAASDVHKRQVLDNPLQPV